MDKPPTMPMDDWELLVEEDNIECLKVTGVLSSCGVEMNTSPMSTRPGELRKSLYGSAPILLTSPSTRIELFWNILLTLDRHLWDNQLLFGNLEATRRLFSLVEQCDHRCFPVLENYALEMRGSDGSSGMESSRFTRLLQWVFLSPRLKRIQATRVRLRHLGVENLTPNDAQQEIAQLQSDSTTLPHLHKAVFQGMTESVLNWFEQRVRTVQQQREKESPLHSQTQFRSSTAG